MDDGREIENAINTAQKICNFDILVCEVVIFSKWNPDRKFLKVFANWKSLYLLGDEMSSEFFKNSCLKKNSDASGIIQKF